MSNSPKWFDDPKQLPKIGTNDHYGVLVRQIKSRAKPTNRTFFRRDTRDSRLRAFGQWLTTHKWNGFFSLNSCLDKFAHFNSVICEAIDRFFPLTRTRAHQGDRPWVKPKIGAWIRKRESVKAFHNNVYLVYLPVCSLRLSHTRKKCGGCRRVKELSELFMVLLQEMIIEILNSSSLIENLITLAELRCMINWQGQIS